MIQLHKNFEAQSGYNKIKQLFVNTRNVVANPKGQLISECLFDIFNSPKKRTNKFDFTTMVPQVELFLFVFLGELKSPKRHFEIN